MVRAYAWRMIVERLLRILISAIRKRGFSGVREGRPFQYLDQRGLPELQRMVLAGAHSTKGRAPREGIIAHTRRPWNLVSRWFTAPIYEHLESRTNL